VERVIQHPRCVLTLYLLVCPNTPKPQAQEKLQSLDWPQRLLQDDLCRPVLSGELVSNPRSGDKIIAGLRIRIGINTGYPEELLLHDVTGQVDYCGRDYDLAAEICDIAAGGQILLGPRTYRWLVPGAASPAL
jgi:class 3 adenylate cyclase